MFSFYLEYVVLALHRGLHVDRLGQERPLLLQLVRYPVPVSRGDGELVGVVAPLQELPLALLEGLELAEQVVEELEANSIGNIFGLSPDLSISCLSFVLKHFGIVGITLEPTLR